MHHPPRILFDKLPASGWERGMCNPKSRPIYSSTTVTTDTHKQGNLNIGDMTLATDNGVTLLGQNVTVNNQSIDLGQGNLVEGGYIDQQTVSNSTSTEVTETTVGVRHAAVDTALAAKVSMGSDSIDSDFKITER